MTDAAAVDAHLIAELQRRFAPRDGGKQPQVAHITVAVELARGER